MPPVLRSRDRRLAKVLEFAKTAHDQAQSRFMIMAPEIVNVIFQYAMTAYDVPEKPYSKTGNGYHTCFWRPGYESSKRIDTALLCTCKLAYIIGYKFPVYINEHCFWVDVPSPVRMYKKQHARLDEVPPAPVAEAHDTDSSESTEETASDDEYRRDRTFERLTHFNSPWKYMERMLPEARDDMKHIHLFLHKDFFNQSSFSFRFGRANAKNPPRPTFSLLEIKAVEFLTLTIQSLHWAWERNSSLGINGTFLHALSLDPRVDRRTILNKKEMKLICQGQSSVNAGSQVAEENSFAHDLANLSDLKTLTFEFEVLQKVPKLLRQLDNLVEFAHSWVFTLNNGNVLRLDSSSIKTTEWKLFQEHDDNVQKFRQDEGEDIPYCFVVKRLTWKLESIQTEDEGKRKKISRALRNLESSITY